MSLGNPSEKRHLANEPSTPQKYRPARANQFTRDMCTVTRTSLLSRLPSNFTHFLSSSEVSAMQMFAHAETSSKSTRAIFPSPTHAQPLFLRFLFPSVWQRFARGSSPSFDGVSISPPRLHCIISLRTFLTRSPLRSLTQRATHAVRRDTP